MYLHEVIDHLADGGKARRLSWDNNTWVAKMPAGPIDLSEEEKELAGLNPDAQSETDGEYLLCIGKKYAKYGYIFTHEDKTHQDWEAL